MLLFHSTPGVNSASIHKLGVLIEKARATPQRIFLHSWRKRKWSRLHLALRYRCDPRQITSFALQVPRTWLTRFSRGVWTCKNNIISARLIGQTFFLAESELDDQTIDGWDYDVFSAPGQVPIVNLPGSAKFRQTMM